MNDLINKVGGIEIAKKVLDVMINNKVDKNFYVSCNGFDSYTMLELKEAISDHDRTDFCNNFENGLSPSTTVINLE